ncbi:lipase 3-like [Lycorma delicatula]|uniref:lipase 3-like n=1 Tax=Lycorma delicatula TaxID=130591 RepID=UPI003F515494
MNIKLKSLSNMWLTFFIFLITTSNKDNCYGEELSFFNRTFLNENIFTTLKNYDKINSDFNFLDSKANYKTEDRINIIGTYLNTTELIIQQGFGAEVHEVKTEDGYILKLTRIITENVSLHTPVFIQHGILSASDQFLLRGRGQDLAFILAENGYDVWLGDQRGNVYSRVHDKYHPNETKFWDFSFHESGIYDLSAFINKIQDRTKASQIIYIGHSLGTTLFLVMASQRPEYAKKIKLAALLAPACFFTPPIRSSIINWAYENTPFVVNYYVSRNQYVISPQRDKLQRIVQNICSNKNTIDLCLLIGGDLFGENRDNLDKEMIPFYFSSVLSGTSLKTAVHLSQLIKTEKFQLYDYGSLKNQKIYGSYTPPTYKIEQIQTPIALLYGTNDAIVKKKDVIKLEKTLPNLIMNYEVPDPKFSHTDFIFGNNAVELVYDKILELIKSYD